MGTREIEKFAEEIKNADQERNTAWGQEIIDEIATEDW